MALYIYLSIVYVLILNTIDSALVAAINNLSLQRQFFRGFFYQAIGTWPLFIK